MLATNAKPQQGFTLVELLVALAVGALLLTGIASSIAAITRAQTTVRAYEDIQETLRFASGMMQRSIRAAQQVASVSATQVTLSRVSGGNTLDCHGATRAANATWTETYLINSNNLECRLDNDTSGVIVAFGVSALALECALHSSAAYDSSDWEDGIIEYESCGSVTAGNVIGLNATLTLTARPPLAAGFQHGFSTVLRARQSELASGP
ncbi:PilW family protein [Marinospirillum alkaliphilum]|uniref:Prepilin-type N-terminal cleavage/methylation domain-containing protein n=1 Tax=Marinospirillum alkaliphilum DSM 21637 TaxID=1122209 RepID=A0A1K1W5C1_9GAMM|nr:prepilin-type N-terminal cleavage/methylation domain-containing protein [Marinospirillum alkaliphilum]SFX32624.1 prepilin-type N-terminal cleavage/methylation domain-containing protein [Marinospirillum alkaliphilum DSM 21637]